MALDQEAKAVLAQIDRNELAQLGCDLTSIPSPTGQEKAIGEFILSWFERNGLKAVRQDVEPERPNAIGILKGDGTGLSLSFNGHTTRASPEPAKTCAWWPTSSRKRS
jgi:acetylornithine deacetylase/succinyl-diaminopimelate desuccinylase-like protein